MELPRKFSHTSSAGALPTFTQLHVSADGLLMVGPPTRAPATHQGHAYVAHNNAFIRVWLEIRGCGLHVFPHQAASTPSMVVTPLDQVETLSPIRPVDFIQGSEKKTDTEAASTTAIWREDQRHVVVNVNQGDHVTSGSTLLMCPDARAKRRKKKEKKGKKLVRCVTKIKIEADGDGPVSITSSITSEEEEEGSEEEDEANPQESEGYEHADVARSRILRTDDFCQPDDWGKEEKKDGKNKEENKKKELEPSFCVLLRTKDQEQLKFFVATEKESSTWAAMLRANSTTHRSLSLEGLNLECGPAGDEDASSTNSDTCSNASVQDHADQQSTTSRGSSISSGSNSSHGGHEKRRSSREKAEASKRHLLQQMLATKNLLERKQKYKRSAAEAWRATAGEVQNEYERAQHETQQLALRRTVLLRQRKNSTAIKMATLEREAGVGRRGKLNGGSGGSVADSGTNQQQLQQLVALRERLSSLDSQLHESEKDTEKTLQGLEEKRCQELEILKNLGAMDENLSDEGGGLLYAPYLRGSFPSLPSLTTCTQEKRSNDRFFGIKMGGGGGGGGLGGGGGGGGGRGEGGRLKGRNPLNFLDLKIRVSRRHKSTENLSRSTDQLFRTRRESSESSDDDTRRRFGGWSQSKSEKRSNSRKKVSDLKQSVESNKENAKTTPERKEISKEALAEIDAFNRLIENYYALNPRHDSIITLRGQKMIL
ncbi:uncharacterized protein LOC143032460 [Oratosquilla oratoria]|uniref:uncharacterized protein LOC143032460 n=1 Tax=Oratosquilla oratoria TaxID=337810 RepID=UPI003F7711D5